MENHWTDDNLIERLYGVGPEGDHLAHCVECARRLEMLAVRKRIVTREPEIPAGLLAAQRTAVYQRMERPRYGMRAVPAFAGACALALALVMYRPAPPAAPQAVVSDAQFFSEVSSLIQTPEPAAAEPIRRLFKEGQ